MPLPLRTCLALIAFLTLAQFGPAPGQTASDGPSADFERKIRPVLEGTCIKCHGPNKVSGGLRLDARASMLEGGDTGPAVVPGDPANSLIIQAIRHQDGLEMPPKAPKLADAIIDDFTTWVKLGAHDPRPTAGQATGQ